MIEAGEERYCQCKIPTPTGEWSVKNETSFACCSKCGGNYPTTLFQGTLLSYER